MSKFGALHKGSKDQMSDGERRRAISAYAAGVSVRDLAIRFRRNHHTIEDVIDEHMKSAVTKEQTMMERGSKTDSLAGSYPVAPR
jgi:transposase